MSTFQKNGETRKPTEEKYGGWTSEVYNSGQIIATSHDLTPNGGLGREIPLFQRNLGWWNMIIWPHNYIYTPIICILFSSAMGDADCVASLIGRF